MQRFYKYVIFSLIILSALTGFAKPVKIISQKAQELVIEFKLPELDHRQAANQGQTYDFFTFPNARHLNNPGSPDLPSYIFTIATPPRSQVQIQVIEDTQEVLPDILVGPVGRPIRDARGLDAYEYQADQEIYRLSTPVPSTLYSISESDKFRDFTTRDISIFPLQANSSGRQLVVHKNIRLRITMTNPLKYSTNFVQRGLLDRLYPEKLLNFDQARHWQIAPSRTKLAKTTLLPEGTFYRITVNEDGLYRVKASTLQNMGVEISNIPIDGLRLFGNGGHALSPVTNASAYNYPSTAEADILVKDLNNNGLFDGSDYLLFYGKALNSWFYEDRYKAFKYQQHPYDTENSYLLHLTGGSGSRMQEQIAGTISGALVNDYYMEKLHFEEDKFNLLASGPDWYGNRFFGLSDSYTFTFQTQPYAASGVTATVQMRFKGGSGVRYGDNLGYRYYFTGLLNNSILFSDFPLAEERDRNITRNGITALNSGNNTIQIQYTGNLDGCTAHLDWIEVEYPKGFSASDDFLSCFSGKYNAPGRYRIDNFSDKQDVYVLDVTNPLKPVIVAKDLIASSGMIQFDLPASANPRQLVIASLSSAAIKDVNVLTPIERQQDLLATSNQADFLVITHRTFKSYADEIAKIREHLACKIVTTDDIYLDFNGGVEDPTAIRNFIRYASNNWQGITPSYVLLFGDGHYDYRHIAIADTMRVPPFEIYNNYETDSRSTDNYYVDLVMTDSSFNYIKPDLAIGRIPVESTLDCARYIKKYKDYEQSETHDGWQTVITFVADDAEKPDASNEYQHQNDLEGIAQLANLQKFNQKKVYLSMYDSEPGGFGRIKPQAGTDLVDIINQGTLLVNYMGHGSPVQWAHEGVFVMNRDLDRIVNPGKPFFLIAATCDFGKYDDPEETSFNEALIWKEDAGTIGAMASTRLVYSSQNAALNRAFLSYLFPQNSPSRTLGEAKLLATGSSKNDQKFVLFADPTMYLADPREQIEFISPFADSLKALSKVKVQARVLSNGSTNNDFSGEAIIIVNDASYDDVETGGSFRAIVLPGPTLFKGQVTVQNGILSGDFIVPKTIRYARQNSGRITLYAWNEQTNQTALGYTDNLLFNGALENINDNSGPKIDIYFQDQESFSSGDLVSGNPVLMVDLQDERGINITGSAGHTINMQIDQEAPKNISGFFTYEKDSYTEGKIIYPLVEMEAGRHQLSITAFDNMNNASEGAIEFDVADGEGLSLTEVVNYPNPFRNSTQFTFQTNRQGADVSIKIYTISGRLIQELEGFSEAGYNSSIEWDGRDREGDQVANGIYLYKITLKDGQQKTEHLDKMVRTR